MVYFLSVLKKNKESRITIQIKCTVKRKNQSAAKECFIMCTDIEKKNASLVKLHYAWNIKTVDKRGELTRTTNSVRVYRRTVKIIHEIMRFFIYRAADSDHITTQKY